MEVPGLIECSNKLRRFDRLKQPASNLAVDSDDHHYGPQAPTGIRLVHAFHAYSAQLFVGLNQS